jgi:membrane protease subunit HflC
MKIGSGSLMLAAIAVALVSGSIFTVGERDRAIKFRFGEIVRSDYEPGLHLKWPVVNNVQFYPKRLQTINNPQQSFLTAEKKTLEVDFFIKWRIADIDQFYRSTQGEVQTASLRLLEIVKAGIKAEFLKRTVPEVVSSERRELMDEMLTAGKANALRLGIELVDVRVKRIEFPDKVSESVFRRMREERFRTASKLRAEGAENAERIRAGSDRERTVLLAEAYRDAEILRGDGDASAASVYADAYTKDPEFYSFTRSIEAYRNSLGTESDVLVLGPDSEFLRYLNKSQSQ